MTKLYYGLYKVSAILVTIVMKVPKGYNLYFEGCDQTFVPALYIKGCAIMEKPIS